MDEFLERARKRGCAQTTIENYEHRLWMMLGLPDNANRPLRWVVGRGSSLYDAARIERAGDTHISGLIVARMWGKWCVQKKMLKSNPFADVEKLGRRRRGSTKPRLTVDESRVLEAYCLAHADSQDCVLTYGYLMLGKRASELVGVTARDLDDGGTRLLIRKAKTEASEGDVSLPPVLQDMLMALADARLRRNETAGSNPAGRLVRGVQQTALVADNRGRSPTPYLFINQSGAPMSRFVARDRVRAVCKAAGVSVLPPQALRRTWFDNGTRQGIPLETMAKMGGHTSVAVTRRSYVDAGVVEAAAVERNLKVMQGGRA